MSELSEKYAPRGGDRHKYCHKIGVFITSCMLEKTCEQCKEEENDQKYTNKPQINPKKATEDTKTAARIGSNNDKKGRKQRPTMLGNRPIGVELPTKTQKITVSGPPRTRIRRTKRAIEEANRLAKEASRDNNSTNS